MTSFPCTSNTHFSYPLLVDLKTIKIEKNLSIANLWKRYIRDNENAQATIRVSTRDGETLDVNAYLLLCSFPKIDPDKPSVFLTLREFQDITEIIKHKNTNLESRKLEDFINLIHNLHKMEYCDVKDIEQIFLSRLNPSQPPEQRVLDFSNLSIQQQELLAIPLPPKPEELKDFNWVYDNCLTYGDLIRNMLRNENAAKAFLRKAKNCGWELHLEVKHIYNTLLIEKLKKSAVKAHRKALRLADEADRVLQESTFRISRQHRLEPNYDSNSENLSLGLTNTLSPIISYLILDPNTALQFAETQYETSDGVSRPIIDLWKEIVKSPYQGQAILEESGLSTQDAQTYEELSNLLVLLVGRLNACHDMMKTLKDLFKENHFNVRERATNFLMASNMNLDRLLIKSPLDPVILELTTAIDPAFAEVSSYFSSVKELLNYYIRTPFLDRHYVACQAYIHGFLEIAALLTNDIEVGMIMSHFEPYFEASISMQWQNLKEESKYPKNWNDNKYQNVDPIALIQHFDGTKTKTGDTNAAKKYFCAIIGDDSWFPKYRNSILIKLLNCLDLQDFNQLRSMLRTKDFPELYETLKNDEHLLNLLMESARNGVFDAPYWSICRDVIHALIVKLALPNGLPSTAEDLMETIKLLKTIASHLKSKLDEADEPESKDLSNLCQSIILALEKQDYRQYIKYFVTKINNTLLNSNKETTKINKVHVCVLNNAQQLSTLEKHTKRKLLILYFVGSQPHLAYFDRDLKRTIQLTDSETPEKDDYFNAIVDKLTTLVKKANFKKFNHTLISYNAEPKKYDSALIQKKVMLGAVHEYLTTIEDILYSKILQQNTLVLKEEFELPHNEFVNNENRLSPKAMKDRFERLSAGIALIGLSNLGNERYRHEVAKSLTAYSSQECEILAQLFHRFHINHRQIMDRMEEKIEAIKNSSDNGFLESKTSVQLFEYGVKELFIEANGSLTNVEDCLRFLKKQGQLNHRIDLVLYLYHPILLQPDSQFNSYAKKLLSIVSEDSELEEIKNAIFNVIETKSFLSPGKITDEQRMQLEKDGFPLDWPYLNEYPTDLIALSTRLKINDNPIHKLSFVHYATLSGWNGLAMIAESLFEREVIENFIKLANALKEQILEFSLEYDETLLNLYNTLKNMGCLHKKAELKRELYTGYPL